jgi:cytochrome c553
MCAIVGALLLPASPARCDDTKAKAYGRHLSAECSACHRIDGVDNGIPSITGWPVQEFMATLRFYKEGSRQNAAMMSVAHSLDDTQIEALAAYYGSLPQAPRKSSASTK